MATYNATITAITTSKQRIIWGAAFIATDTEQAATTEEFAEHTRQMKINYLNDFSNSLFMQLDGALVDGEESMNQVILRTSHVVMLHINFHLPESLKNAAN